MWNAIYTLATAPFVVACLFIFVVAIVAAAIIDRRH
jgi:hypothetical protein